MKLNYDKLNIEYYKLNYDKLNIEYNRYETSDAF